MFFNSQFNYCPLIWMFYDCKSKQKMSKLHKRTLRIAYDEYCSSFEELLDKDWSVTIHQHNLRALAIEMYKISNGLSPTFMVEMMNEIDIPYNTRSSCQIYPTPPWLFLEPVNPGRRSI